MWRAQRSLVLPALIPAGQVGSRALHCSSPSFSWRGVVLPIVAVRAESSSDFSSSLLPDCLPFRYYSVAQGDRPLLP